MATVTLKSVDNLFDEKFFIPAYQRGYRWDETQIKELLEDLYDFCKKRKENEYYCLQPIIVKQRDDSSWEVVDGQQRLTALWIIFALYYCSNRRDIIDLEHRKYDMEYEEKETFTELFSIISDKIRTTDYVDLSNELANEKSRSIDSKHLIESIDFIIRFKIDSFQSKGILSRIFEVLKQIQVIWYVLDDNEDPIQTFTNVNANKIALTNSELIKAVLLNNSEKRDEANRALQWEEIEIGLNDESLWGFIAQTDKVNYSTRIDYLFEIICARENWLDEFPEDDRYRVYRAVIKHLKNFDDAKELWGKVQETYDILCDWYDNYFFYHIIGLLMIVTQMKATKLINQLYAAYTQSSKTDFKKYLVTELRNTYIPNTGKKAFSCLDKIQIQNDLEEYSYDEDADVIKIVLLLYNIALLVIAGNEYERFPFDLYKADIWNIEHINPQTPKESSDEEKRDWLLSYKNIISDVGINAKIDQYLQLHNIDFEDVVQLIEQHFDFGDKASIGNLVILDSSTNSSYKNACFSDKRKVIIEKERTNIDGSEQKNKKKRKYIPIGTKWVFLKGYEKAQDLKVWGPSDMAEYKSDMTDKIYSVLGGVNNAD